MSHPDPAPAPARSLLRIPAPLLVILLASYFLRAWLVVSGGQTFWPDEARYEMSRAAARALWAGDAGAFREAFNIAHNPLFTAVGIVPATLELAAGDDPRIPALFFSAFSVASLLLLRAVMLRLGESERAALWAAGLLALCATHLYYSRHLLPYDTAMALGLLALFVGLRRPARPRDSIACGLLAACSFLTYSGYWTLAAFALLAHALRGPLRLGTVVRRGLLSGAAFAALPVLSANLLAPGHVSAYVGHFAASIAQGVAAEGGRLPLAYAWHAEHFLVVLWAAALIWSARAIVRGDRSEALRLGVAGVVWIYGCLVAGSVVFGAFVVYGRLARLLGPFVCMLAAIFLARAWSSGRRGRIFAALAWSLAAVQAVVNFHRPLTQVFPEEFRKMAAEEMQRGGPGEYVTHFVGFIYPAPPAIPVPPGRTILERRHPLEFLPYQYEGWTPEERRIIRSTDIRMRLVRKGPE